jgi:hypothetical protein
MTTAVLISGTSSGIGRATVERLVRRPELAVYATARRPEALADLADTGARVLALDVTEPASMAAAVKSVEAEHGRGAVRRRSDAGQAITRSISIPITTRPGGLGGGDPYPAPLGVPGEANRCANRGGYFFLTPSFHISLTMLGLTSVVITPIAFRTKRSSSSCRSMPAARSARAVNRPSALFSASS